MPVNVGPLSNAARNLAQIGRARGCWLLVALILGIHGMLGLAGAFVSLNPLYLNLGLSREGFWAGKVWQVGSYALLHGSWLHAGLNALFLLVIGARIEHMAGRAVLFAAVAIGILGGAAFHLLIGAGLLVGVSGACIALLILLTTLSPQSRMLPVPVSGRSLGVGLLLAELALALVNPALGLPGFAAVGDRLVAFGLGSWFELGHACHFGGGIAGWLVGRWLLRPRVSLAALRRDRARREAG
jgi:membrane associated rhomboid family serine protease